MIFQRGAGSSSVGWSDGAGVNSLREQGEGSSVPFELLYKRSKHENNNRNDACCNRQADTLY